MKQELYISQYDNSPYNYSTEELRSLEELEKLGYVYKGLSYFKNPILKSWNRECKNQVEVNAVYQAEIFELTKTFYHKEVKTLVGFKQKELGYDFKPFIDVMNRKKLEETEFNSLDFISEKVQFYSTIEFEIVFENSRLFEEGLVAIFKNKTFEISKKNYKENPFYVEDDKIFYHSEVLFVSIEELRKKENEERLETEKQKELEYQKQQSEFELKYGSWEYVSVCGDENVLIFEDENGNDVEFGESSENENILIIDKNEYKYRRVYYTRYNLKVSPNLIYTLYSIDEWNAIKNNSTETNNPFKGLFNKLK